MDYKNRVPGNLYPSRRPRRIPLLALAAAAGGLALAGLGYALWPASEGEETKPVEAVLPPPPATTSKQLAMPPLDAAATARIKDKTKGAAAETAKPPATAESAPKDDRKKAGDAEDLTTAADPVAPPVEPRFTFYKILPEKEVIIPESEIKALKRDEGLGSSAKPEPYQIQVGSYNSQAEAERIKAKLSQLKVKSKIENVKIENTQWFRVKIGPFDKLADADKVRDYLKTNQMPTVVQRSTGR